jgi:hypothetical protein
MPWTFSMQPVDVGLLLFSARQDAILCLQRRHCRTKGWQYLQAVSLEAMISTVRMLICFELLILPDGVMWECVGHVFAWKGAL